MNSAATVGKLILLFALSALLSVLIYAHGEQQFNRGKKAEQVDCLSRDNTALMAANKLISDLQAKARESERQHAQDMAAASSNYQKELTHARAEKDRALADLRSGALRLRIPSTGSDGAGTGAVAQAVASAGRCDGEAGADLPAKAAEFLIELASEADEVVNQLTACQAVVAADRKQQGD